MNFFEEYYSGMTSEIFLLPKKLVVLNTFQRVAQSENPVFSLNFAQSSH